MRRDAEKLNLYREKGKRLVNHGQVVAYSAELDEAGFRVDEKALLLLLVWKKGRDSLQMRTLQFLDHEIEIAWNSIYTR